MLYKVKNSGRFLVSSQNSRSRFEINFRQQRVEQLIHSTVLYNCTARHAPGLNQLSVWVMQAWINVVVLFKQRWRFNHYCILQGLIMDWNEKINDYECFIFDDFHMAIFYRLMLDTKIVVKYRVLWASLIRFFKPNLRNVHW